MRLLFCPWEPKPLRLQTAFEAAVQLERAKAGVGRGPGAVGCIF